MPSVPKEELVKSLSDAVVRVTLESTNQQLTYAPWRLVRKTLQCIVTTPHEIDKALKEVR